MGKILRFGIVMVFFSWFANSTSYSQHGLKVEIIGLRNNKGVVSMELLNNKNESVKGATENIQGNKCTFSFDNLQSGKYAIRFFHDENENKEMDTNFIGIPKEGIGFSNDALGTFGPKGFEEWLFDVNKNTTVVMKTNYILP